MGGVTRYFAELHRAFRKRNIESDVLGPFFACALLNRDDHVLGVRIPRRLQVKGARRLIFRLDQLSEPAALALLRRRHQNIVFHRTNFSSVPPPRRVATAITVHDMIHERRAREFPASDKTTARKKLWCRQADVVIAISQYTKMQLIDLLEIEPEKIFVCHHGATLTQPDSAALEALQSERPYLLYLGDRYRYKNFDRLIAAFGRTSAAKDGVGLVAFGGGSPTASELERLSENGVSELVSFKSGGDAILAAYYANALGFVYPSLDEGFGLPPLEAMLHNCPVAASDAGAIPEVVGDAALLFDPEDAESMANAIDALVTDSGLRARLVETGAARASLFSWESTADSTLEAYAFALSRAKERL
ncbi:MAG: glycosyltransferase family 4 protein [Gaiellaceae bacterium]